MAPNQPQRKPFRIDPPLVIALVFFIVTAFVAVIIVINPPASNVSQGTGTPITADTYRAQVDALLAIAQPQDAESALVRYGCVACHRAGNAALAPAWDGLAARAATERPPLAAAAYIYESIVDPGVFLVEGYNDVMPHDFATRMSQQELADVLAYLLSPDAH